MKKKCFIKSTSWHNVAKWPPSATTPWTLTLLNPLPHNTIFLLSSLQKYQFLFIEKTLCIKKTVFLISTVSFQIFICPKQPTYPCKKNIFSRTTYITWFLKQQCSLQNSNKKLYKTPLHWIQL